MSTCPNCGREPPAGAAFCPFCGADLQPAEQAREERKLVSVLFVDLVGFTSRSDRADPEDVRDTLQGFHASAKREIERFGGTVEKFIGDAVMAVFGAPVAHGDDAERAVRAGLRVVEAVDELNRERDGHPLEVRAAVNTGEAVIAVGTRPESGEALALGDVVNTASRLQTSAPPGGLVVGEETFRATQHVIGRCLPYGQSSYRAFADQVRFAAGIFESEPPDEARRKLLSFLQGLMPGGEAEQTAAHLGALIGLGAEDEAVQEPIQLFFSARRFVEEFAEERPTGIVFEDIHWAEPAQLDLLEYLSAQVRDRPVLFLALARSELLEVRPTWGGGVLGHSTIPLEPLSSGDSKAIASHLLPEAGD